jgi:hypothetical protein
MSRKLSITGILPAGANTRPTSEPLALWHSSNSSHEPLLGRHTRVACHDQVVFLRLGWARYVLSIDCVLFRFVANLERILIAKVLVKYESREEAAYAADLQMIFLAGDPDFDRLRSDPRFEGHVSVQTTERYLGCKQRIRSAVNDRIGIEPNP